VERPRDLQEPVAHQVGAERDAGVDDPLRHLEIGGHCSVCISSQTKCAPKLPMMPVKRAPESRPKMMNLARMPSDSALIRTSTPTWMPVRTP